MNLYGLRGGVRTRRCLARKPERFTAFRFNDDIVLGVWLDELDVEHVQLLELVRH